MGKMNPRYAPIFLLSAFILFLFLPAASGIDVDFTPEVPLCGHISPASSVNYSVYIEPQTPEANFTLKWRDIGTGDSLDLVLHSPSGLEITPASPSYVRDGTSASYAIRNPESGIWATEIRSGRQPAAGEDYCISVKAKRNMGMANPQASFNGLLRDFAEDTDDDGLGDYVTMAVGVNIKAAGNYTVAISLYDVNSSQEIHAENTSYLGWGSKTVMIELYDVSTPGPYRLKSLELYDEEGNVIDRSGTAYTTRMYSDLEIMARRARLNGSYSDYGSDINGDGLYDYLTIDAGVDALEPGNYSLMGFLCDANGTSLLWSIGSDYLLPGTHIMHLDFDGKSLWRQKVNGPYRLCNITLFRGDSFLENLTGEDAALDAYATRPYNYTQFVDPVWPEKTISGSGSGEILLTISVESIIPVFQGRYSYDIVGVSMPPITSNWTMSGYKNGYVYDLPGVHMPGKPNNFTVTAWGVKDLNVGVRKNEFEKSGTSYRVRSWISSRAEAGDDGKAIVKSDLISPGMYQFKIFGDAADNIKQVTLEMKVIKKLIINGNFKLAINTSGFPSGNYSINARALNGSLKLDEISLEGPSRGF